MQFWWCGGDGCFEWVGQWIVVVCGVYVLGLCQIGIIEGEVVEQGSEMEEVGYWGNFFEGKVLSEYIVVMIIVSFSSVVGYCSQCFNWFFLFFVVFCEYFFRCGGVVSYGCQLGVVCCFF